MSNDNIDAIIAAPWDDGDVCHPADANALRAEVVRLRERDAAATDREAMFIDRDLAWRFLAVWSARDSKRSVYMQNRMLIAASEAGVAATVMDADPVALATALNKDWRISDAK